MKDWGKRLTAALERRGHQKTAYVAATLGVNESSVSRWKSDGNISMGHAVALCRLLNVSMDWMFLGEDLQNGTIPSPEALAVARIARHLESQPLDLVQALLHLMEVLERR